MKRTGLSILLFCCTFAVSAHSYQIKQVKYELGSTQETALSHKIPVDTERIFNSRDELEAYKSSLLQQYANTRVFESVEIEFKETSSEKEPVQLSCSIKTTDSKTLLVVPYPKYDSNSGITVKLKAKNSSILGSLEELNFELSGGNKLSDLTEENGFFIGGELNFTYPFYKDPFAVFWNNDFKFEYNFQDSLPQFTTQTGLSIQLPLKKVTFILDAYEGAYRDFEYTEFDDELYYKTYTKFSAPIELLKTEKSGNLTWSPFVDFEFNYEKNEINKLNDDLSSPVFASGNEIFIKNVNWIGNFRSGHGIRIGQKLGYNTQNQRWQPKIYGTAEAYAAFKYNGIAAKLNFFHSEYNREKIGEYVRGIVDKQRYANYHSRALKTPSAIVLNLDFPVHIITTDWIGWGTSLFGEESWFTKGFSWMKTFNFEFQISPFVDAALTKNEATGRLFSYKDGWYGSGVEFLVYPEKWKSIVVRGSVGFDIGRKLLKEHLDYSWRKDEKSHEIYVGIGLLY